MIRLEKSVPVRLKRRGLHFEILVDSDLALAFRRGEKNLSLDDVVVIDEVFSDARKGKHASDADLELVFKTKDRRVVCEIIIMEGEIPLTVEHLRREQEMKKRRVIDLLHRYTINPQTGLPHPPQRIENALKEAKVRISEHKSAEEQIEEIIKSLQSLLPLRYEVHILELRIPSQYSGPSSVVLRKYGRILSDIWDLNTWVVTFQIPAGLQEELEVALNSITKGTLGVDVKEKR